MPAITEGDAQMFNLKFKKLGWFGEESKGGIGINVETKAFFYHIRHDCNKENSVVLSYYERPENPDDQDTHIADLFFNDFEQAKKHAQNLHEEHINQGLLELCELPT